jgi:hypothetical protein
MAVYLEEAHAKDEWPVGEKVSICEQPKNIQERAAIAGKFIKEQEFQLPMVIDAMNNNFQKSFAAWPFRFYIVHQGRVALKAQPDAESHHYDLEAVREWLNENVASA